MWLIHIYIHTYIHTYINIIIIQFNGYNIIIITQQTAVAAQPQIYLKKASSGTQTKPTAMPVTNSAISMVKTILQRVKTSEYLPYAWACG